MIRISQIKIDADIKNADKALKQAIKKKLRLSDIPEYRILKKSLDARHKPKLYYVYTVELDLPHSVISGSLKADRNITEASDNSYKWPEGDLKNIDSNGKDRPVIIGMGPAGLFCAYMLAVNGCRPIVYERGLPVDERTRDVEQFFVSGELNPNSNVQFGEGGAGTFSDGKLNTLVNDRYGRNAEVLKIFVKNGAPDHILYDSKPHIGTDILRTVVKNMRHTILECGGDIYFEHKLTDIKPVGDHVKAIINDLIETETDALVLAIGHSARDTYHMLAEKGIKMSAKPFAVGLRVLHPQSLIDMSQYGRDNSDRKLPPASYKLTHKAVTGRNIYSFCMCPGGYVVNASSESGLTVVNGMSYSKRAGHYANSGIIMNIDIDDFGSDDTFAGLRYLESLEKKAYDLGGGHIPVQTLGAYKAGVTDSGAIDTDGFKGNICNTDLTGLFDKDLKDTFIDGMKRFDQIIPGFGSDEVILAGVESRTSSPVRILRDETYYSSVSNIYPCGEGAGYAGGITSAAMDGIIIAEEIWKRHMTR